MRPVLDDVEEVAGPEVAVVVEAGLALGGKIQALVQVQVPDRVGLVGEVRKRIPTLHPHTPNNNMEILEVPQEVQVILNKITEQALESKTGMFHM